MADIPQALHDEFPDHVERIRNLHERDPEFRRKADEFHQLSRAVHRAEMDEEPVEEAEALELRKRRELALDELSRLILL